jgi:hypothetical protein
VRLFFARRTGGIEKLRIKNSGAAPKRRLLIEEKCFLLVPPNGDFHGSFRPGTSVKETSMEFRFLKLTGNMAHKECC